jgi:hypothetical protein
VLAVSCPIPARKSPDAPTLRSMSAVVPATAPPDDLPTLGLTTRRERPRSGAAIAGLFTVTAFVGAGLLFTIQPLVARLLLPAYGGSATVWSTCSLFFQTLLIVGYVYSHVTTTRIPRRAQPWLHLVVLATPLLVLPVVLPTDAVPGTDHSPVGWLLRSLVVMIGLPFVVLATTGPLLQRWYSWSDGPRREDPYFLFAASNVGSFGGLLAYPFLVEPRLTLDQQGVAFTGGFVVFAALTAGCAVVASRGSASRQEVVVATPSTQPSWAELARWCGYAFVPSCLMLAVTHHLSTDVAPIPLLWVAPLALYLATFVAAFAVRSRVVTATWPRAAAGLGMATLALAPLAASLSLWVTITVNLLLVVVAGYAAHRLLAARRPSAEHLTTYYLAVAVGGALGGVVNGLLAPVLFDRVLEYGLVVALLPLLGLGATWPTAGSVGTRTRWLVGGLLLVLVAAAVPALLDSRGGGVMVALLALAAFTLLGWVLAKMPVGMTVALLVVVLTTAVVSDNGVVDRERTFYGSYTVHATDLMTSLDHGTTMHGLQLTAPSLRDEPTTYYGREAPLGDLFGELQPVRTAAVGLGVGTLAAYGEPGDRITFLEIDEAVAEIARDERYFTFLSDSAADVDVRIGDGRLLMADQPEHGVDLVVLDAFSSDAIPVHLLTQEAFTLYADRVAAGGAIAVHVSNRHFDLVPVLAAARTHLGWAGAVGRGGEGIEVRPSTWIVLSPDHTLVDALLSLERWQPLDLGDTVEWTDDYSSVLTVLR